MFVRRDQVQCNCKLVSMRESLQEKFVDNVRSYYLLTVEIAKVHSN